MTQGNAAVVRRLYEEVLNKGNIAILDDLLAHNFVDHNPIAGQTPTREGYKAAVAQLHASGSRWLFTIVQIIQTRDLVVVSSTARPVREDGSQVDASAQEQAVQGAVLYRIVDGKITDRWGAMGPMQQLRVLMEPPGTADQEDSVHAL